ncbi:MAG TPA: hypothetical protein VK419_16770 [Bryobacteraceae bacterium]|nr:hypothetical protein [Bryobacteraceae bacterium]
MHWRTIKAWWLVAAFLSGFALAMWAEELVLNWRDNRVEFSAPRVHFIGGKPLELLHNAAPVPFDFQFTLYSGTRNQVFQRLTDRFVISYDLWEEKFKVVKTQSPRAMKDHLTSNAAEAWCFEQMSAGVNLSGLADTTPFWARLEIRAQDDARDGPLFGRGRISESGISLTSLIELFSRPAQSQQSHWGPYEAGPFTLAELKRSRNRGS